MKKPKNRKLIMLTSILILAIFMSTVSISLISAQEMQTTDLTTYAFLAVTPNPVGVNQPILVSIWILPISPDINDYLHGFEVTITKPNGSTETIGPLTAYAMGGQFFSYTPTTTGTYSFRFNYAGETFSAYNKKYLPSETPTTTVTVQEQARETYPTESITDDYWSRPINAENREWSEISGNWLMRSYNNLATIYSTIDTVGAYNPYSKAPQSPHIMWTSQLKIGGITGGEYGSSSYYTGLSYEPLITPPIIINGRLFYNTHPLSLEGVQQLGFTCIDLRTGEKLWENNDDLLSTGQLWNYQSPNQMGTWAYLWSLSDGIWSAYDASTGEWAFSFENALYGPIVFGEDGTMFAYILAENSLSMWSPTKAFEENGLISTFTPGSGVNYFVPLQGTFDWSLGIVWDTTIPDRSIMAPNVYSNEQELAIPTIRGFTNNVLMATVDDGGQNVYAEIGYDMITGEEIWYHDATDVVAMQTFYRAFGEGIYTDFCMRTRTWTAFDITTGNQLWVSDETDYPWGSYLSYAPTIANGVLYCGSFSGYEYAFDIQTGDLLWKFYSGDDVYAETALGQYAFWYGPIIADNVVFAGTGEETPTQPMVRGNKLFAIDATKGTKIWSISGMMDLCAIADGYLVAYNGYDTQMYVFGKGPSATTLSAPQSATNVGSTIVITGTVTDQSAGAKNTPAISDADMTKWMEYLYMQKSIPTDVTGVPVTLTAIGSDGARYNIGTATSDVGGSFAISWTPPSSGTYKVIADFIGTASYGSSYATTQIIVSSENTGTSTTGITNETLYLTVTIIALIAAILAIIIAIRKR